MNKIKYQAKGISQELGVGNNKTVGFPVYDIIAPIVGSYYYSRELGYTVYITEIEETSIKIIEAYSSNTDMTFIVEEVSINDGWTTISSEVKGFYYGHPNEDDTKKYYGTIKAEYLV